MQTVRVIPCLDIRGGRVVKGVNFEGMRDAGDPVEFARAYERAGADELAFLDITASLEARATVVDLAGRVAEAVSIPLTVGGGIRSVEDIDALLRAGAAKVSINSAAVRRPELLSEAARRFGSGRIVLAVDAGPIGDTGRYDVYVDGGRTPMGMDMAEWCRRGESLGAGEILLTGVNTDGVKRGYDIKMLRAVSDAVSIPLVASGGAGKLEDFLAAVVDGGADAVLAASVFHYGELEIGQVKRYLSDKGVPVKL